MIPVISSGRNSIFSSFLSSRAGREDHFVIRRTGSADNAADIRFEGTQTRLHASVERGVAVLYNDAAEYRGVELLLQNDLLAEHRAHLCGELLPCRIAERLTGHDRDLRNAEMIVAALILYAGITALFESVEKVLMPVEVDYSAAYLVVVTVAIAVKIFLGLYVRRQGRKANSDLLVSSGTDALFDAILSTAVLVSAIVYLVFGFNIEAFVSIIISIFIIKTGVEIIREAVDDMLGHRVESDLTKKLKDVVLSFPEVYGAYDIVLHNYGPDIYLGSLHIEIDDTMTADKIDSLTREINTKAYEETGIILTAVGIYSRNTSDDELMEIRTQITKLVVDHDNVLQMHGFYIDEAKKRISLDVVIDFAEEDRMALLEHIRQDIQEAVPGYEIIMTLDSDISDQ